jgi:2-dehydro-3-deoxy-D-arabinonate dehydratase
MKLYRTTKGVILQSGDTYSIFQVDWDRLINAPSLRLELEDTARHAENLSAQQAKVLLHDHLLPPASTQEVWAAGVTYMRSRDARMEEAKAAGGGDFYDKVYEAPRPELFFKSSAFRVSGSGDPVFIREDSTWNVPEPELTLFINQAGEVAAYTIGNDMSSRSIEGENPLYLPQAKVYERSAALGPALYIPEETLPGSTQIAMKIHRQGQVCFEDAVTLDRMKRSLDELADYLCRGLEFPTGAFLMTGTCLVPDGGFTLQEGDQIAITIDGIGTLENVVKTYPTSRK